MVQLPRIPAEIAHRYLISESRAVQSLLSSIGESSCPVLLVNPQSQIIMHTRILAVTTRELFFACDELDTDCQPWLQTLDSMGVTYHERVNVQWPVDHVNLSVHADQPALVAPLPVSVLRLQRREYFRLNTLEALPLHCVIPTPQEMLKAKVLDISAGGLALLAPPEHVTWTPGMEFPDCQIELPGVGSILATLRVRNVFMIRNPDGSEQHRSGCEFVHMHPSAHHLIRRYMVRWEQERNAERLAI